MFAPPPTIRTEVFARIPDKYRITGRSSPWIDAVRPGQAVDCFLEGPSFDRAGNLYVVDVAWGRIFRIAPDGAVALVAEYDGEPNGLKIHKDGRIFIADYRHGIMLLDPASGGVSPVVEGDEGRPFKGLNDLHFASNGDLYFTDQGHTALNDATGRLYCLRANGKLDLLLEGIPSPNGLTLSLDERTLFLNVTRNNAVWRVPMRSDGTVFRAGIYLQLSGGIGPDGLAIDEGGGLAVAHIGFGAVWLFDGRGEPAARIHSCAGLATTNVAYGGTDRRKLYITESETGQVLVADVDVPGRTMYAHA